MKAIRQRYGNKKLVFKQSAAHHLMKFFISISKITKIIDFNRPDIFSNVKNCDSIGEKKNQI